MGRQCWILVGRARAGDRDAFGTLAAASVDRLYGVRFVIDASYRLDAPPAVAAEVQAIVDSIELQ